VISSLTQFSVEPNSLSLDPSWLRLSSPRPWLFLTQTQGIDPLLDSDSILIWTCFLNLLLEFTRTTYSGNLHPFGLPDLTWSAYPNLARITYPIFIRASYPSLTGLHQCLLGLIRPYPVESPYPILLPIRLLLIWPYTVLPDRITLPNFFWSDFCLPDRTRPPYPTSLPGRVTLRCTQLLTRPYLITLPDRVPFNWPHPKTSSLASHLNLCLFWLIMHQDSLIG
jgi:hypothetical protein